MNRVILLTACVNPGSMIFTKLQNPVERLNQYKETLIWYLKNTNYSIVFCENTNTDISLEYKQYIKQNRLEYICFDGNNYDKAKGKGYGEALIIEHALSHSNLLKQADQIIKITGRIIVKNINMLVWSSSRSNKVYANRYKNASGLLCDSRFFISSPYFLLQFFLPKKLELNDSKGYYFEHLLYHQIREYMNKGGGYSEFYLPLKFVGISGTNGKTLNQRTYLKAFIRFILNKIRYK